MTNALTNKGEKMPLKEWQANHLSNKYRICRFKGATLIEIDGVWVDMTDLRFSEACYTTFGPGIAKNKIAELKHLFDAKAEDKSHLSHLIAFGQGVWDSKKLAWDEDTAAEDCIYRVPYDAHPSKQKRIPFIMDLACGDEGVYDDIMQSIAPIIMFKKPTGVIWYLGGGANGKSTLVHLLYMIFGTYFTELTVKQLEDERDTPQLNGKLGNICKESSEGFVEDTRTYKSIGTHESFKVHKFHSQDTVEIEGNLHHIFSANNIPTFGDKSYGARRRTLVIPFNNRFKPDESFEDKTFTPQFIEAFIAEIISYALRLKEQNYEYQFSEITKQMKEKYDTDANTAQTYADELIELGVRAFTNFNQLRMDYEEWCGEHGYRASSINVLRRSILDKGFDRRSVRIGDSVNKIYSIGVLQGKELVKIPQRLGLFKITDDTVDVEDIEEEKQTDLLEGF